MSTGGQGAQEEGGADSGAAAADEALAAPLAGLAGPGSEPGQRRDLTTVEGSEFGQFGDQRAGR